MREKEGRDIHRILETRKKTKGKVTQKKKKESQQPRGFLKVRAQPEKTKRKGRSICAAPTPCLMRKKGGPQKGEKE